MTERTRCPLHTERAADVRQWTDIGWTDCGEHPSLPGWCVLEWRNDNPPVAPFKNDAFDARETNDAFAGAPS